MPLDAVRLFHSAAELSGPQVFRRAAVADEEAMRYVAIDRKFGEGLAAVDRIRPAQRSLRGTAYSAFDLWATATMVVS